MRDDYGFPSALVILFGKVKIWLFAIDEIREADAIVLGSGEADLAGGIPVGDIIELG